MIHQLVQALLESLPDVSMYIAHNIKRKVSTDEDRRPKTFTLPHERHSLTYHFLFSHCSFWSFARILHNGETSKKEERKKQKVFYYLNLNFEVLSHFKHAFSLAFFVQLTLV
jgi:hypothetical protein